MRVMIVGGGLAGTSLANTLHREEHAVTLVDRDPGIAARGFAEHGLVVIVGDGTEPRVLVEAGVGKADVVLAMLRRDADNLAVAAIARAEGAARVLVRQRDPRYAPIYRAAGIDQVFGEIDTMVGALSIAITHPRITHSMVLGRGASIAFEFVVPGAARVAGKTVKEIGTSSGFPRGAVIAGIEEADGDVVAPRGDSVVQGGRAVLLVAKREDVQAALDMMTEVAEPGS